MKKNNFKIAIAVLLMNIFTFFNIFTGISVVKAAENKDFKILIVSPGNKNEIYETEKLKLAVIMKDKDGNMVYGKRAIWESQNPEIAIVDEEGLVTGVKEGKARIKAMLEEDKNICTYCDLVVNHKEKVDTKATIKEALRNISEHYKEEPSFDYLPAMAAKITGKDFGIHANNLKRIMIHPDKSSFTVEEMIKASNALYCAQNIISIVCSGKDPYSYEYKGKKINFVNMLVKSQKENGQFIIIEGFDKDNIKNLVWAINALDMAGEQYNVEKAVKALMKLNKDKKYKNVSYGEIGYKAMTITALSKHKDIDGVKELIDEYIKEFKTKQNDKGGFNGAKSKINSSVTTAMVIQGLIANDIDPLSWFNSGKSMLDSILEHQKDNGTFIDADGEGNSDYIANDNCYAALSDLYTGKSMVKTIKLPKNKDLKVDLISDNKFKNGEDANVEVKVRNNTNKEKEATLIVQLFDENSTKMVQYSYINKNIEGKATEKLKVGLAVPCNGKYIVKVLVWDNMDSINPLMDEYKVNILE